MKPTLLLYSSVEMSVSSLHCIIKYNEGVGGHISIIQGFLLLCVVLMSVDECFFVCFFTCLMMSQQISWDI